ncbi:MAG: HD domain-containing protein [Candidatus Edwardsbacteria bacterium]|nr:HD domain-containing protein [Candidatus Edwardsbacteria bacterium]
MAERTGELKQAMDKLADANRKIHDGYLDTICRLMMAAEYKDGRTGAHIRRSSHYAKDLAGQMGLAPEFCTAIFYAAPMHDVGKVGIPDSILLKPGPLDGGEWKLMKEHTTIGAAILQGSESGFLKMAEEIALSHHEQWSGHGYPRQLAKEGIPLAGRIVSLADHYDALRTERPYKAPMDHWQACQVIFNGDGRTQPDHFDPEVLDAFQRRHDIFKEIYHANAEGPAVPAAEGEL